MDKGSFSEFDSTKQPLSTRERWLIGGLMGAAVIVAGLVVALFVNDDDAQLDAVVAPTTVVSEQAATTTTAEITETSTAIEEVTTTVPESTTTVADTTTTTTTTTPVTTTTVPAPPPLGPIEYFVVNEAGGLEVIETQGDQIAVVSGDGEQFVFTEVVSPSAFFLVAYSLDDGQLGSVLGQSTLQAAGVRRFIPIVLDVAVADAVDVVIVVHVDADNDGQLTLPGPDVAGQFANGGAAQLLARLVVVAE
jgi:cytoskeletal protein RodZ